MASSGLGTPRPSFHIVVEIAVSLAVITFNSGQGALTGLLKWSTSSVDPPKFSGYSIEESKSGWQRKLVKKSYKGYKGRAGSKAREARGFFTSFTCDAAGLRVPM